MESSKSCLLSNSSQVQSSLTEQSKSVGLGVEFVFLPPQELVPTTIYKKRVYYRLVIVKTPAHKLNTTSTTGGVYTPNLNS